MRETLAMPDGSDTDAVIVAIAAIPEHGSEDVVYSEVSDEARFWIKGGVGAFNESEFIVLDSDGRLRV